LTVDDSGFTSNVAGAEGGALSLSNVVLDVQRTAIEGNSAGTSGGGMLCSTVSGTISQLWLTGNTAANYGGGLYSSTATLELDDVVVSDNEAGLSGAGMYVTADASTYRNLALVDNVSLGNGGGATLTWYGLTTIDGARVAGNTAVGYGGGMQLTWGAQVEVTSATIHGNDAASNGGGVFLSVSPVVSLTSTAITGNTTAAGGGGGIAHDWGTPVWDHCDVWGNTPSDFGDLDDPTGTSGNISVDPRYLDTSATSALDWDLHLDVTSPLVDAGAQPGLDPDASDADIGAYGGPTAGDWDLDQDGYPEWWQPGPYDGATYPAAGWDCDDLDLSVTPLSGC
jgi:predicted outer membrane repeat protein